MVRCDDLERLLAGREERWLRQRRLLASSDVVLQAALNVPGLPKAVEGDVSLLEALGSRLEACLVVPSERLLLVNGAGAALLLAFRGVDPLRLKEEALSLEEGLPWGRILDIDVLTEAGSLSRQLLGRPLRSCLLCDLPSKICARQARHPLAALREAFLLLFERALGDVETFRSDCRPPLPFGDGGARGEGPDRP